MYAVLSPPWPWPFEVYSIMIEPYLPLNRLVVSAPAYPRSRIRYNFTSSFRVRVNSLGNLVHHTIEVFESGYNFFVNVESSLDIRLLNTFLLNLHFEGTLFPIPYLFTTWLKNDVPRYDVFLPPFRLDSGEDS